MKEKRHLCFQCITNPKSSKSSQTVRYLSIVLVKLNHRQHHSFIMTKKKQKTHTTEILKYLLHLRVVTSNNAITSVTRSEISMWMWLWMWIWMRQKLRLWLAFLFVVLFSLVIGQCRYDSVRYMKIKYPIQLLIYRVRWWCFFFSYFWYHPENLISAYRWY